MSALEGKVLFPFIAPPNGGKGTQTNALSLRFGIPKIDMGALLREIGKEQTDLGKAVRDRQDNGRLVDTTIVIAVLKAGLIKLAEANPNVKGFILDGFPRNIEQGEGLFLLCEEQGCQIARAFYLKVPDDVIMLRAISRRICPVGNEIYNLMTKPPLKEGICDIHGVPLIQRVDDQPDKVLERIRSFTDDTRPVLARFRETGHFEKVDGNRPESEITDEISEKMQVFFNLTAAPTTV
ncbi:MAG: nucleoside monophosphate kinase [Cyanobacteria bacterium]|nr:nucleoside monophosphate kinase [Cyanobacteriota bacterium]